MSYEALSPPTELPSDVDDTLNDYSPEFLQHVGSYVEELAEYREREECLAEEDNDDKVGEQPDDLLEDVPSKVTITVKKTNDNRYYYWQ